MKLTYNQKSDKLWSLITKAQSVNHKWKSLGDFEAWLKMWGGRLSNEKTKQKGFIVRSFWASGEERVLVVPVDFAERCIILDGLP